MIMCSIGKDAYVHHLQQTIARFLDRHPKAGAPLRARLCEVEHSRWKTFADLRKSYPSLDHVVKYTVFNIGGNKYRLVVVVHFNRGKIYARHIMTHEEYDRRRWNAK